AGNRLGGPPERVVDYLALVGDSSDNVPGVKGVGEKTALELLSTFGDLDAILANAERIAGKRAREAVLQHADLARLSRELVTIRRDVPVALDLEVLRVRPPDVPRLTELFTELEFRSLIPKLSSLGVAVAGAAAPAAQRAPPLRPRRAPRRARGRPPAQDPPPPRQRRAATAARAARGPRGAEGGAQRQVRLARAAPGGRGPGGRRVRLDARELRARPGTSLARDRRARQRAALPADAHLSGARGTG